MRKRLMERSTVVFMVYPDRFEMFNDITRFEVKVKTLLMSVAKTTKDEGNNGALDTDPGLVLSDEEDTPWGWNRYGGVDGFGSVEDALKWAENL